MLFTTPVKYLHVTHALHIPLNPISDEKKYVVNAKKQQH